ncbi:uncharacterized protein LOC144453616 [Glandiceps talaboti]
MSSHRTSPQLLTDHSRYTRSFEVNEDTVKTQTARRNPKSSWARPPSDTLLYDQDTTCFNGLDKVDQVYVHQCEQADMLPYLKRIHSDEQGRTDSMASEFQQLIVLVNNTVRELNSYVPAMKTCDGYADGATCSVDPPMVPETSQCVWNNSIAEEESIDFYASLLDDLESSGSKMQATFQQYRLPDGSC